MSSIIKLMDSEIALSTANTVSNGRLVRVLETGVGNALITVKDSGGTTLGTVTMLQGTELAIEKKPTDTLTSNSATTVAVSIGYRN